MIWHNFKNPTSEKVVSINYGWEKGYFLYSQHLRDYKYKKFAGPTQNVDNETWSRSWRYVAPKEMVVWNEV